MCGIVGWVGHTGEAIDGEAMIASLHHRGPDSQGAYDARVAGRRVFLGHARLSIIDLSDAGAQPMEAEDVPVTLAYNGEVYNFQELRDRFLPGVRLRSRTDTEVLLRLYCALGPGFVEHLNGDFAIAILDERVGRRLLFRDPMGVKPLYVHESAGAFAFASEVKAFRAADLPLTLSEEAVQRFMVFKYVPGDGTMHREVRRMPPGSWLEYDVGAGRARTGRFWTAAPDPDAAKLSGRDARERLRELMGDAVRIRLMADVPVGTFFSGGVDSSIIASFLRDRGDIVHYCARKTDEDLRKEGTTSDFAFAQGLADAWGLDLRAIDIATGQATPELVRRTLWHSDDLIADGFQIPSSSLATSSPGRPRPRPGSSSPGWGPTRSSTATWPISWCSWPATSTSSPAASSGASPAGWGAWTRAGGPSGPTAAGSAAWGSTTTCRGSGTAPSPWWGTSRTRPASAVWITSGVASWLAGYFPEGEDPFHGLTRFEMENFLVKNLHYLDRMCMANSVEGRVPYMDPRVVAFALGLRHGQKLSPWGTSKKILKDAFAPELPRSLRHRRKAGFGMPLRSIFSDEARAWRLLDLDFFGGLPVFDVDRIPELVRSHAEGREDNSSIIYAPGLLPGVAPPLPRRSPGGGDRLRDAAGGPGGGVQRGGRRRTVSGDAHSAAPPGAGGAPPGPGSVDDLEPALARVRAWEHSPSGRLPSGERSARSPRRLETAKRKAGPSRRRETSF